MNKASPAAAPPGPTLAFAPLTESDIDALAPVAQSAPDPFSAAQLREALKNPAWQCFVAHQKGRPAALACFSGLAGEEQCDLQLLAVHPALRRAGIGRALLAHGLLAQKKLGRRRCLLEVRASNAAALGLYRALGFRQLALRRGMYGRPPEDGILMSKDLTIL